MKPQKSKTKIKMRNQKKYDILHDLRDWLQEFGENLVEVLQHSFRETQSKETKTLPRLLMNASKSGTGFG